MWTYTYTYPLYIHHGSDLDVLPHNTRVVVRGSSAHTGTHTYIYVLIHTYAYIYMYVPIHTCICIYIYTDLDVLPHNTRVVVQGLVAAELVEAEARRGAVVARGEDAGEDCCGHVWFVGWER